MPTPVIRTERRHTLTRIAAELDRQRQEAVSTGANDLASLIGNAIVETDRLLGVEVADHA